MKSLTFGAAVLFSTCCTQFVQAAPAKTEYIYIESNVQAAGGNSILAFSRTGNGTITPLNGSPFATGGTGVQDTSFVFGPYDSDQNIVIDQDRQLLFAVNSGSDTIAVFHINGNGALTPVNGSPFPSGGVNPVSLGQSGDKLFIVNKNGDFGRLLPVLPNYTALQIENDGSLSPITDLSPVQIAWGSSPSQAYVVPGTNLMFGTDFRAGLIESFNFDRTGQLTQHQPLPLPQNPAIPAAAAQQLNLANFPLNLWTHPFEPLVYVSFVSVNQVGVYKYDEDGDLSFIRAVPDSGQAICWLRANKAGTRLYASNNGVIEGPNDAHSTISVFDLTDPETPKEIQNIQLLGVGNSSQISLNPSETTLYVIAQRATPLIPVGQGNALHVFAIQSDGTISENISPITLNVPNGTQPQGIAIYSPK
ncbi:MAG: hypothetical protein WCC64_01990 [Aliidongia sp.]